MNKRNAEDREKKLLDLHRRARYSASKLWHASETEDIANEVVLSYLKNPESKSTVDQVVVDWIRQNGWRSRGGKLRVSLPYCESYSEERISVSDNDVRSIGSELQSFERYLNGLEKKDRCIAVLRYVWDFTEKEIAYCLGLSESRISQRLKRIHQRIQKTLPKDDPERPKDKRNTPKEMARMVPKKKKHGSQISIYENIFMAQSPPGSVDKNNEEGYDQWLT